VDHLVVAAGGLTFRMSQDAQYLSAMDPPITPLQAGYTGRAAVSEKERPGSLPFATAYTRPLRQRLIGGRYSEKKELRRRRETFTGQHHQPLCPGDPAKHPERAEPVTEYPDSEKDQPASSHASAGTGAWHPPEAETRHLPNSTRLAPPSPSVALRRWLRTPPNQLVSSSK